MTKRIRRPAELLTVSEITELERLCSEGNPNHVRVIAGHLFFSFMAGARWHDTMYIVDTEVSEDRGMFLDGGFNRAPQVLPFKGTTDGVAALHSSWTGHA